MMSFLQHVTFLLTYASQSGCLPHPHVATHRDVAPPPAVKSVHTAMDHNTSVVPHHLHVGQKWNWATFSWENIGTECLK